jgi:hypothetical protein
MLEVEIAGITISLDVDSLKKTVSFKTDLRAPENYEKFGASQSKEALLVFYCFGSEKRKNDYYEHYFNSSGLWDLRYKNRNEFMLNLKNGAEGHSLASITVNLNSKIGNIFYTKEGISSIQEKLFPFAYPADEIILINLLPSFNGVLVHACGIDDNGKGVLFLGTSGSGKSTTTRLWMYEKDVKVLSDDRIVIREINDKSYAYGTPWHGEVNICDPGRVEINKIFFIEHSDKNCLKPVSHIDAATRMLVRSFPTFWNKEGMELTLSLIDRIVKKVPCYEFGFVPDKSAVDFIRNLE